MKKTSKPDLPLKEVLSELNANLVHLHTQIKKEEEVIMLLQDQRKALEKLS